MDRLLACECGRNLTVSERSAGVTLQCFCGLAVKVPPLSELRTLTPVPDESEMEDGAGRSTGQIVLLVLAAILFAGLFLRGCLWAFSLGGPGGPAYLILQVGQIWLLVLMARECRPDAVVLALIVPFLSWFFAFQRWDIARWPFLLSAVGFLVFFLRLRAVYW